MKIAFKSYSLKFQYPFTISKGTKTHQPTFIVALEQDGIVGYGEAPAISYYNITTQQMENDVEKHRAFLENYTLETPEKFWTAIHLLFAENSFALCALDIAAHDWYGKKMNQPLYQLWSLADVRVCPPTSPLTDYTIGIDTPEKMLAKMQAYPSPIYKIKLGTADDLHLIKMLRQHTTAKLRVDANAGWPLATALSLLPELEKLEIELIEQPLAKNNFEEMILLKQQSSIPLFADESCVTEADVKKCATCFDGINIKLTKCGGITPALRMIKEARELNLQVMIGSMNESTIGTAAVAHLLPLLDKVDMDGPLLLAQDLADGLHFDFGKVIVNAGNGLGISIRNPLM